MATARSPIGVARDRISAVPLRALWLAALLFGVVIVHGACAGSSQAHLAAAAPVAASSHGGPHGHAAPPVSSPTAVQTPVLDEGGGGTPAHHQAETCVSGQPQQGAELPAPCAAPTTDSAVPAPAQGRFGVAGGTSTLPPLRSATGSVVQQV
ncbi:hypothetical protein AB0I10_17810 [Streptomyces sp. NPDC050636]|uniref:hypothetical protein n=1 Tax=Streptomyces sp. NPDC050636 TaxID=3154510 RepID=UPI00342930DF